MAGCSFYASSAGTPGGATTLPRRDQPAASSHLSLTISSLLALQATAVVAGRYRESAVQVSAAMRQPAVVRTQVNR
jgi:hypothetical protein